MGSCSTLDGSKYMPELLPEDKGNFLGKEKLPVVSLDKLSGSFHFSVKLPFSISIILNLCESIMFARYIVSHRCDRLDQTKPQSDTLASAGHHCP